MPDEAIQVNFGYPNTLGQQPDPTQLKESPGYRFFISLGSNYRETLLLRTYFVQNLDNPNRPPAM